ncbi:MAG: AMP-dependent synthetase and ligase, partial [Cryptosporangiaceae bacterium]|nr:AMP-dependent synthetase and ligase [Cryptosporangiaceae bacterium]
MRVPLTIGDFLARAAGVYGDREALVDEPGVPGSLGRITYTQLHRRARGMACELERRGVAPGDRVAIVSPNSGRFLVSFFGVSGWGRVLVPVNYRLTADEIRYVVEHSGASVLLVDPEYDEALRGVDAKVRIVLDGERDAALFAETDETPSRWAGDEDATASINYTSGTTARPKGVQLTHRNCWLNAAMLGWHLGVGDRDVYLHTLPMFHANGWGMPYAITGMGGRHVVQRKVDGEEILRRIAAEGVTVLAGAPAVVAAAL